MMKLDTKAREAKNAYLREWRKKNPERARAIQARYWAKKAEQMRGEREDDGKN